MSNDKSQLDRFKQAARQLETDDDEERFNGKLRKLAKRPSEMTDEEIVAHNRDVIQKNADEARKAITTRKK